jgi:hypothetical protein
LRGKNQKRVSAFTLALVLTVGLRLLYSGAGVLLTPHLKLDPTFVQANRFTDNLMPRSEGARYALLGVWERFDSLWYIHIAENGYDRPEAVVFYPLYPLLIRILSPLVGQPLIAALLISTISSFFLFFGFQKLLELDLAPDLVRRGLILFAAWPASFILFAGYPESLLIALVIWSIYFARVGNWWCAALLGFFAGLTKAAGILGFVPLAVLAWRERSWRAIPAGLCVFAPVSYLLYLNLAGHPLPSEVYPKYWGTQVTWPWITLFDSLRQAIMGRSGMLNSNLAVLALVFGVAFSKRIKLEYTLYAVAALWLFLMKRTQAMLESTMRYLLEVFPAYVSIAYSLEARFVFVFTAILCFSVNLYLLRSFFEWSLDV